MRQMATRLEIPEKGARKRFGRLVATLGTGRCSTRDNKQKATAKQKRFRALKKPRKKSAYTQFLSSRSEAYKTVGNTFNETRCVSTDVWAALPPDQKSQYQSQANQLNDTRAADGSFQYRRANGTGATGGKNHNRRVCLIKLSRIRNHPIYKGGLQLCCYDSGLKPCHVDSTSSDKHITTMVDRSFSYNADNLKNPPTRNMAKSRNCYERFGGLCRTDWGHTQASNLTFNLYAKTRHLRPQLPVLITFTFIELPTRAFHFSSRSWSEQGRRQCSCVWIWCSRPL